MPSQSNGAAANVCEIDANEEQFSTWVGIDLGTTNSCVSVWRKKNGRGGVEVLKHSQGGELIPSCVSFSADGQEPVVGREALDAIAMNPENSIYEMKRLTGRTMKEPEVQEMLGRWKFKVVADSHGRPMVELQMAGGKVEHKRPVQIQTMILAELRETACLRLGADVRKAVISVPAYFEQIPKAETKEAARLAGFEEIELIQEPTAAAFFYGFSTERYNDCRLFVFDMGGGTFDCTVLHVENTVFRVVGIKGDHQLGGCDFDWRMFELMAHKIKERYNRSVIADKALGIRLRLECKQLKERLSSQSVTQFDVSIVFPDLDGYLSVTRAEFEQCCAPLVARARATVTDLLADKKLKAKEINEVLLVGGGSRLPMLQKMISTEFGIPVDRLNKSVNLDEAVARGAALYAAKNCQNMRSGIPYTMSIIEATPLSLGASGRDGICWTMIKRNSNVPCSTKMRFELKNQIEPVTTYVKIVEGESILEHRNRVIGMLVLEDVEPDHNGKVVNYLTFELDKEGTLTATYENDWNNQSEILPVNYATIMAGREHAAVQKMLEEAEQYKVLDEAEAKRRQARQKLEMGIEEVEYLYNGKNSAIAKKRQKQCEEARSWLSSNMEAKAQSFTSKLTGFRRKTDDYDYDNVNNGDEDDDDGNAGSSSSSSSADYGDSDVDENGEDDDDDGITAEFTGQVGMDGIKRPRLDAGVN